MPDLALIRTHYRCRGVPTNSLFIYKRIGTLPRSRIGTPAGILSGISLKAAPKVFRVLLIVSEALEIAEGVFPCF